jgi:hypothetical protein
MQQLSQHQQQHLRQLQQARCCPRHAVSTCQVQQPASMPPICPYHSIPPTFGYLCPFSQVLKPSRLSLASLSRPSLPPAHRPCAPFTLLPLPEDDLLNCSAISVW